MVQWPSVSEVKMSDNSPDFSEEPAGSEPHHGGRQPALTGCPWHDVNEMLQAAGLRPTRQRMALGWLLFGKGGVRAEFDVRPELWFFGCHFKNDPVMPGCLGLDALWQLLGFFLGWMGGAGKGRALGMGEIKFTGQVLPNMKNIMYGIDIKRVMRSKLVLGIADGWLSADGSIIYRAFDIKVGLFRDVAALQPAT